MGKVIRFEIQVPNPEEAIQFYSSSFGWEFEKMPGQQDYWFIITGENGKEGIDGGLMKSPDGATRTTNSIDVPSVEEYLLKVIENGGQVVVPKTTVPSIGYFAYCIDNQGLLFGVSEVDKKA